MAKIHINNPKQVINGGAKKYYFKVKGLGGPKGDKGDKGDTGATGPQGPQGNAATVSIGSTTTLPVGYDATVTNSGSIYNAVLNFGIPQGPRGPQGATGAKGDKGDKGDQGNPGPQGEKGTNATVYVGTTSTLNPGSQATVYNSGTDSNAVLNFGIPKGEKGDTGATGPAGADGQDGQDGQNFTPTIVDTLPTVGDESNLYLTPKNYTTGTATGNPITISLGEDEGAIDSFQLDGDTFQQSYTGKNLFDSSLTMIRGFVSNTGTIDTNTTSSIMSEEYIPVSADTVYTFSWTPQIAGSCVRNVAFYTESKAFISRVQNPNSVNPFSVTTPSGCAYIRFNFYNANGMTPDNPLSTYLTDSQIERGSSATSFEPFVGGQPSPNPDYPQQIQTVTGQQTVSINGTNYPISLGSLELCKLGSYQDYIWKDGEDWKVHKAMGKTKLEDTIPQTTWSFYAGGKFYAIQSELYSRLGMTGRELKCNCLYYWNSTSATWDTDYRIGINEGFAFWLTIGDTTVTTNSGLKDWFTAHNATIYYPLATATDTTITDTTLIAQLEAIRTAALQNGTNIITNTATGTNLAGDMEFDYYEYDPTNRYDKWLWLRANNAYEEFNEEGGGGGGGSITVDSALSTTSKNPVQNKVVTAAINSKVDSSSLATVATSGSYNDLSNKPTIPTIPTQTSAFTNNGSDGTSTYVEADELATVATTGAYSDLSGTPTIPTATGDLTNNSGFITSADLPTKTSDLTNDGSDGTSTYVEASGLATVATSGSYNDLSNKPTIPTVNNGTLTIRQNGKTLGTFTANQSTNTTVNLTDNSSYSTSEVKTSATWINGKPIYKKTFSFTLANAEATTVNHGISNFGLLIKFEGAVVSSSTKNVPIPRTLTSLNYQVGLEGVTTTSFEVDVGADGPRGNQAYITLWYTKTTD